MSNEKSNSLANQILTLKAGERLPLKTKTERIAALHIAKSLRDAGAVSFKLVTKKQEDGTFVGIAV